MQPFFPLIILNARPGAGKSEILHYLKQLPTEERAERFHIGPIHIIDDFPMLWTWFEEDDILDKVFHRPRLHATPDGYFLNEDLWHLLVRRMALDFSKRVRDRKNSETILIEFSRGTEHGGYQVAYPNLSDEVLSQAACLYVNVSLEESLRKNRARFNPDRPDSILEHGLSDEKIKKLYSEDDWAEFCAADPNYLSVREHQIPFVIFENEDDVTTLAGSALANRLEKNLNLLWDLWVANNQA